MRVAEGQTLVDVLMLSGGSVDDLFNVAMGNEAGLTDNLVPGYDAKVVAVTAPKVSRADTAAAASKRPVVTSDGQDWFDVAIQEHGTIEVVFEMLQQRSLTGVLLPGTVLTTGPGTRKDVLRALKGQRINTGRLTDQAARLFKIFDYTFDFTFE
jgi:hypothetical protein